MKARQALGGALAIGIAIALVAGSPATASDDSAPATQEFPAQQILMDPSGAQTTSTFTVAPGRYTVKGGADVTLAAAATYTCTGKTDNPHYSSGAASVIAKTRVTCSGPAGNIPIRVYSLLGRTTQNNVSTLAIVAESNYVQNVAVNIGTTTWYVPAQNSGTHIPRAAYFRGSHSGQGAPPLIPFTIGAAASSFIYVP